MLAATPPRGAHPAASSACCCWTGNLQIVAHLPLLALLSVALTFQRLAYSSAVPQLVPKRYLGHANGIVQLASGIAQLLVPLLARRRCSPRSASAASSSLDVASYAVAIAVVLLVRFPRTMAWRRRETVTAEIRERLPLLAGHTAASASMLLFFAVLNVFLSPLFLLISPLVLSFAALAEVGQVSVAGGARRVPRRPGR